MPAELDSGGVDRAAEISHEPSGSLWGLFSVLTKGVVDQLDRGIPALLRAPESYVWVVVAIAATAWERSAFRAGPLTASLPAVTVAEPIVGSMLGVTVLGETLHTNDLGWWPWACR